MAEDVFLRSLEQDDLQNVYRWHNDSALYETLTSPFHPVSRQTVGDWIARKSQYSEREVNFAICLRGNSDHIGNIYLRDIDYINRTGFLGAFIGDAEHRGKGYASQALLLVVKYAFEVLGLNRLFMYVLCDNPAAVRHLQKCGFSIEGQMRQHVFKNGTFKDVHVMGMCRSDYAKSKGDPSSRSAG